MRRCAPAGHPTLSCAHATYNLAGTMGLKGNLTAGEIVEQLVHALRVAAVRNVVFMVGTPSWARDLRGQNGRGRDATLPQRQRRHRGACRAWGTLPAASGGWQSGHMHAGDASSMPAEPLPGCHALSCARLLASPLFRQITECSLHNTEWSSAPPPPVLVIPGHGGAPQQLRGGGGRSANDDGPAVVRPQPAPRDRFYGWCGAAHTRDGQRPAGESKGGQIQHFCNKPVWLFACSGMLSSRQSIENSRREEGLAAVAGRLHM